MLPWKWVAIEVFVSNNWRQKGQTIAKNDVFSNNMRDIQFKQEVKNMGRRYNTYSKINKTGNGRIK